jgi:hypothetical protein
MSSVEEVELKVSGQENELSIEEENRIRAQLGLAPLATRQTREMDEAELRYMEYRQEQQKQVEADALRKRIEK